VYGTVHVVSAVNVKTPPVGATVGALVGAKVGVVGAALGNFVGATDGETVDVGALGLALGEIDRDALGLALGDALGPALGLALGLALGTFVGAIHASHPGAAVVFASAATSSAPSAREYRRTSLMAPSK